MIYDDLTKKNIFKFIIFFTFIDLILFSVHRLLIKFGLTDENIYPFTYSDFFLSNYFIFILCSLAVFILTIILTLKVPINTFKIHMDKKFFFWLLIILLLSSIYIFFIQQDSKIRYTSGSITTLPGLVRVFNYALIICLFIIYQLNRKQCDFKSFIIILISSVLIIDGLNSAAIFFSIIVFEFYRLNLKKKFSLFIFILIGTFLVLEFSFSYKYNFSDTDYASLASDYTGYVDYMYNFIIPRFSVHAEQLYSYISQDLDISNYSYLSEVIIESFKNRINVIFNDGYNIFYPKTVGQSILWNMQYLYAPGGTSPGYLLSVISFLPFTLPLIILIAFIYKQVSLRLNESVNFIQVACFCFIIKITTSNLLDMLGILSPELMTLILVFLSCHIFLKNQKIKKT